MERIYSRWSKFFPLRAVPLWYERTKSPHRMRTAKIENHGQTACEGVF